jgi:hypothetical protein
MILTRPLDLHKSLCFDRAPRGDSLLHAFSFLPLLIALTLLNPSSLNPDIARLHLTSFPSIATRFGSSTLSYAAYNTRTDSIQHIPFHPPS